MKSCSNPYHSRENENQKTKRHCKERERNSGTKQSTKENWIATLLAVIRNDKLFS